MQGHRIKTRYSRRCLAHSLFTLYLLISETFVAQAICNSMAPKSKAAAKAKATAKAKAGGISSQELETLHGTLLSQPPYSECSSPYLLHKALIARRPPIAVTYAVVKVWWESRQRRLTPGISSAQELHDKHGAQVTALAVENPTYFKLCKALRELDPPIFVTDGVAKQWLSKLRCLSGCCIVNAS